MNNPATIHNPQTLRAFLWEILKPYKWWCLLMLQAPLFSAFYVFGYNYSLKLLINAFSNEPRIEYSQLVFPIFLFMAAQIGLDVSWRFSNFAEMKAEPSARRTLLLRAYNYTQYHSYSFFQNTHTGSVISKLKGILEGFDYVLNLHHTLLRSFCIVFLSIATLLFVNVPIFLFMLGWCILLFFVMYPMCLKLNQLSNEFAESNHRIIGIFSDNITNIFSLLSFAKRKNELSRIETLISTDCLPKHVELEKYNFKFSLIGGVFYGFMLLSVLLFMVHLRKNSTISIGDFLFVMLITLTIGDFMWVLISGMGDFMKKTGTLGRLILC